MTIRQELDGLQRAIESFASLIRTLPAEALAPQSWGPREVLSHLVFWHEHYVYLLMTLAEGDEPELPFGSFPGLNALAVARFRDVPVSVMLRRLLTAQRLVEEIAERPDASRVHVRIKIGATSRPLREFLARVASHIRGHERQMRRSLHLTRRVRADRALRRKAVA